MKVSELIEKLKKFDPKLDIFCIEDCKSNRALDITDIIIKDAEKCRNNNIPCLKFGHSELSSKHVLIEVTSDF